MDLRVLGPIEAHDGRRLAVGGPRQRRILAALAMHAGDVVSVDRLADVAWTGEEPPEQATRNVRSYVNRIREGLGDVADRLVTAPPGYVLELRAGELDAADLLAHATAADDAYERGDLDAALRHTERALARWRGRPYAEFADEEWARAEVQRLEEARAHVLERRCEVLIEVGRPEDALGHLEILIAEQPYRERPRRLHMLALYHAGRSPEALRAFQRFRSLLVEEVGVDPSTELIELDRRILEHAPTLRLPEPRRRRVRGYELHEIIGEGAFAVVWRATQPVLGREVAVKQVRDQLADDPDFIRRFEVEARIVAALEHPYIVPLYDYWREPGAAYLVLRMMSGGTLEMRLHDGPLDDAELVRLVEQVGAALRTAHQHGVIHRDVKPGNVLLDDEGNFFLTDFGIAFGADGEDDAAAAALSTGSPAYAAPEQLRRESLDARTDIYAFGMTLFEAATGEVPFRDEQTRAGLVRRQLESPVPLPSSSHPAVPDWVDRVVARATATHPDDRYLALDQLLADVAGRNSAGSDRRSSTLLVAELRNPFKGLRAFAEADAGDFRGRQRLVVRLLAALRRPGSQGRFVAAVGPSGSGKSSVVRAGLIPELRRGGIEGSAEWFLTTMVPGAHPFEELERALVSIAAAPPGPLAGMMESSERGIARAVQQVIPDEDAELLLVIDQFEELFVLVDDETHRRRFVDGLMAAVKDPRSRLRVLVTIRADFWDRPLRYPALASVLETAAVTVSPLAPDELERVIVEPVAEQGMSYEPGLVARISAEVVDQPGALPLLQYTLTQLFDRHVGGVLTSAAFDAIGGVSGSVAQRADEIFVHLTDDQRSATRRLFGRLVTLGEGSEDTRRRVTRAELGDEPATARVIEEFGRACLLTFDRDPVTRGPTVEVAHEALIREWPRLRAWVDEDRDRLRVHRHLTTSAASWDEHGRDDGELFRGVRLDAAETLAAIDADAMNPLERDFLAASIHRRDAERSAERGRVRRLRRLVAVIGIVAVIALIAGTLALRSQRRANDEAARAAVSADLAEVRAAEADAARVDADAARVEADAALVEAEQSRFETDVQRLRSTAIAEAAEQPEMAALLAVEAARLDPGRASDSALHRVLTAVPGYRGHLASTAFPARLARDGTMLVAVGPTLDVWDLTTMTLVNRVDHDMTGADESIDVSADGRWAAISGQRGTRLYDLDTGERGPAIDTNASYLGLAFSPDSSTLALELPVTGTIRLVDTITLATIGELSMGPTQSWRWSPTEDVIHAVDADGSVVAWDVATGSVRWRVTPERPIPLVSAMAHSPDGGRVLIAVNAQPSFVVALDTTDGSTVFDPTELPSLLWDLAALDDAGDRVLGSGPGTGTRAVAYDLRTGELIESPVGGMGTIGTLYSEALGLAITWGNAGVDLWATDRSTPLERRVPLPDWIAGTTGDVSDASFALSPDGTELLASTIRPGPSVSIDTTDPAELSEIEYDHVVGAGRFVLTADEQGVVLRDESGAALGKPIPMPDDVRSTAASEDGRFFAIARAGGIVDLHAADGARLDTLTIPGASPGTLTYASFSGDGSLLAAYIQGQSNARAIWQTDTLELLHDESGPSRLRFILAGDVLYTNRIDLKTIDRLDPLTLEPVGRPLVGHASALLEVAHDPEHGLIATRSADGTVRLWDETTGRQFGRDVPAHGSGVQFVADGALLSTQTAGYASLWNLDTGTWPATACRLAGRNLTREEWTEFGPRSVDYRATCDQYPIDG